MQELAPKVAEVMKHFDWLVYFKAGARNLYAECIKLAAGLCGVPTALIGYGFMGGFGECLELASELREGRRPRRGIRSLEICIPSNR